MNKTFFEKTGIIDSNKDNVMTSELIGYLKSHIEVYGDTEVHFSENGNDEVSVQLKRYTNAVTIDVSNQTTR